MIRALLLVALVVPWLFAALTNRFAALLLYFWFAFFRPEEWLFWIDFSSLRLSLIFGIILVVPALLTETFPNISHPLSVGTLLFLGMTLIAQTQAVDPALGWVWIDYLTRLMLVCLLGITLLKTRQRIVLMIAVAAGSFGVHSAKGGAAFLLGRVESMGGLAGSFLDNNGYAIGTAMILPLLVAAGQNVNNTWIRRAFFAAVPLSALTIVCTFSRSGFLALATAVLVFIALQRRRLLGFAAVAVIAVLTVAIVPFPKGYFERIETIQTYEEIGEISAISRPHFWRVAVAMAADRPFGVGLRNFEPAYNRYDFRNGLFGTRRSSHSSHFQVLAETGFGGLAIWMSLFALAFFFAARVRRRSRDTRLPADVARFMYTVANALIASMCAFLVGGAFIALALNDLTWLTFGLVAALDRVSLALVAEHSGARQAAAASSPARAAGRRAPILDGASPA